MAKTIQEINEKIRKGKAVVYTAEEVIDLAKKKGTKKAAAEVDVVTTGTFAPMCSSGAYFNVGHSNPRIKLGGGKVTLNDVPVYTGFAAVDLLVGATGLPDDDPRNKLYHGGFPYGGAHLIEDLVAGRDVRLTATAYGTDCYPRRTLETWVRLDDMNEAVLFNMRNAYQNYNVAVNLSDKIIYTYMGVLQPNLRNANYCSAGQLSPLLNDPLYRTIGIGTRVFLCGAQGYVAWNGTQHNPDIPRLKNNTPLAGAGTLALIGNMKHMSPKWLRAVSFTGYGVSLSVAIGIPIPILDEEMMEFVSVSDEDIKAPIVDYSVYYPTGEGEAKLGEVTYGELKSGSIEINGKEVPTGGFSSYAKAREVAEHLKLQIINGDFLLTQSVSPLPGPTT